MNHNRLFPKNWNRSSHNLVSHGRHDPFLYLPPPNNTDRQHRPCSYVLAYHSQSTSSPIHASALGARTAKVRICADGGANRLHDELPHFFPGEDVLAIRNKYKPDVIKGDMDSVRRDVLHFYSNLGTKIFDASQDQDSTDLHKCVNYIHDLANADNANLCILVVGALGGRFDHEIGNINVLCRFSATRIILLSDDCLIQLLPGTEHHEIHIQSSVEGPHCGLIPIGTPSGSTTTTGLQWDLNNTEMRFGGLISTSNIVKEEIITVHSQSDLLWTISIKNNI